MPGLKRLLTSKFEFQYPPGEVEEIPFQLPSLRDPRLVPAMLRLLKQARGVDVVFISNPQFVELIFVYLLKTHSRRAPPVVVFDLIMRAPGSLLERVLARVKRRLLTAIDVFVCIHRDLREYQRMFGVRPDKCRYVPFKANNFDLADHFVPVEGDYVLSLGASHRDYKLLAEAVKGLDIPVKIVVPQAAIKKHNANINGVQLPANVEHVSAQVDRLGWSRYIAESRFVVVPLLPGVIQPAGISVYLEAMVLGKAVVISRGSSTENILDDDLAVLVPPGDVKAMRAGIEALWNDSGRRRHLEQASRRYALSLRDHARLVRDLKGIVEEAATGA